MKIVRSALLISIIMSMLFTGVAFAEPESPEALYSFTMTPASGTYPGQEITFNVDWSTNTQSAAGDGIAICVYYDEAYSNTPGRTDDGFTGAPADILSLGFGDAYTKIGPSALSLGAGPGSGATQACPAWTGKYVTGYYIDEAGNGGSLGASDPTDALEFTIISPRLVADESFTVRQRKNVDDSNDNIWSAIGFKTANLDVNPAALLVFVGTPVQCGANVPCYDTVENGIVYVADGGAVRLMGASTGSVVVDRGMTIQGGASAASITGDGDPTIEVDASGETVIIRDLQINAASGQPAISVLAGDAVVKGNTIDANTLTAFSYTAGTLHAYANNVTDLGTASDTTSTNVNLKHNWWGDAWTSPTGLVASDWAARLGAPMVKWADGVNSVNLDGATLSGGTGTVAIVSHDRSNPPFGNGITPFQSSMCGPYLDYFLVSGSGSWTVAAPVDDSAACNLNTRDPGVIYMVNTIAECTPSTNTACWDRVTTGVSVSGQTIYAAGISTAQLGGTQFVVGSTSGSDPTVIQLRSMSATSARNTWLPMILLVSALLLGGSGLYLARKAR